MAKEKVELLVKENLWLRLYYHDMAHYQCTKNKSGQDSWRRTRTKNVYSPEDHHIISRRFGIRGRVTGRADDSLVDPPVLK